MSNPGLMLHQTLCGLAIIICQLVYFPLTSYAGLLLYRAGHCCFCVLCQWGLACCHRGVKSGVCQRWFSNTTLFAHWKTCP